VAKQHGHELAPAGETAGMALRPVLGHNPLKLVAGKQLQHLAENAGYSCHGGGGPPDADYVFSTQTVTEFYRRRSKPNLDKSGSAYSRTAVVSFDCTYRRSFEKRLDIFYSAGLSAQSKHLARVS
jgi:hypothetical protein